MIRFNCPSCGTEISIPDNLAGQSGKCVACNTKIVAPGPPTQFIPDQQPSRTDPPAPASDPAVPRRGMDIGTSSAVCGVVAILICWIPPFNFFSLVSCGVGGIMAITGLFMSATKKWAGLSTILIGLALNVMAFLFAFSFTEMDDGRNSPTSELDALRQQQDRLTKDFVGDILNGLSCSAQEPRRETP